METKPMVEFCASNMHHGTAKLMNQLEQDPHYEVVEYGCLGNCGQCYAQPFALVNGRITPADTVEALADEIVAEVKRQSAAQAELDRLLDMM